MIISTRVWVFTAEIFYSWVWPSFLSVTLATHLLDYLQSFQYDSPNYKNQVVINSNCCLTSCLFTTVQKAILSLTSLLFLSLLSLSLYLNLLWLKLCLGTVTLSASEEGRSLCWWWQRTETTELERGKWEEDPGLWGCLISAGPSDGFDRPQAPIRLQD